MTMANHHEFRFTCIIICGRTEVFPLLFFWGGGKEKVNVKKLYTNVTRNKNKKIIPKRTRRVSHSRVTRVSYTTAFEPPEFNSV